MSFLLKKRHAKTVRRLSEELLTPWNLFLINLSAIKKMCMPRSTRAIKASGSKVGLSSVKKGKCSAF